MTTARTLYDAVREAWASIPAPPADDLKYMTWGWGEEAWQAFVNVAPVDVDIGSVGFLAADPLLDLPDRAAAAYLGTYLMAMLLNMETLNAFGVYINVTTSAHTITCLTIPHFWEDIKPFLPPKCREVLARVTLFFASEHETLLLTPEQVETMRALAADILKSA